MAKIFYWMHNSPRPSGGEKHSYEHVDILNAAGFEAYALHLTGERHRWFDNQTRVVSGAAFWDLFDRDRDYLVVPETLGPHLLGFPGRKVIFNKNLHQGFRTFQSDSPLAHYHAYCDPSVVAILAVSEHNAQHLRFAFPYAIVRRVFAGLDPELYRFRPLREKKKQIVLVDKATEELDILMRMLAARNAAGFNTLHEYEVIVLHNLTAREAARLLSDALLLVSLNTREGLPRTIMEAMASGCLVAAYGTGPLAEILPPPYSFLPDDLVGLARHIEGIMAGFPDRLDAWGETITAARQTAAAFSRERQRTVLLEVWRDILARGETRPDIRVRSAESDEACLPLEAP
jgi:glycosyltransferase involved in cell wall biosynthesis